MQNISAITKKIINFVFSRAVFFVLGGLLVMGGYAAHAVGPNQLLTSYMWNVLEGRVAALESKDTNRFGGMYVDNFENAHDCVYGNPLTGACSCPAGFAAQQITLWSWAEHETDTWACYR